MKKTQKHYHPVIGIVVLLVIALFVAWYIRRPDQGNNTVDSVVVNHDGALETNANGEMVPKTKNAINVTDQVAGSSIDIDYLSLQEPGYVVIHEANGSQPGKILARSNLLTSGAKQDLIIRYATSVGTEYYAVLHSDDDSGTFDASKDLPIIGSDALPVMAKFKIVQ